VNALRPLPKPPEPANRSAFLPRIEALRGFAALAVAWLHSSVIINLADGHKLTGMPRLVLWGIRLSIWATNGRAAVMIFFVISGLVLGLMIDAAAARGMWRNYAAFLLRRAFRIYPAHCAALLLFVPLAVVTLFQVPVADPAFLARMSPDPRWWFDGTIYGHFNRWEFVRNAILYDQMYNSVTWSLRVEMQACFFIPFLVWLTRRNSIALDVAILAALIGIAALVDASVRPDSVFLYLPAFHLGAIAGSQGPRIAAALGRRRYATATCLVVCYLTAVLPAALARSFDGFWMTLDMTFAAFGLVVLIAWAKLGRLDGLFLNPVSRWIGRLSYSFYLWHWLLLAMAMRALLILAPGAVVVGPLNQLIFFALAGSTILATLGIAALSYRWVERPFMILGRSVADRVAAGRRSSRELPLAAEAATAP
jgi:peptidoglycan/LPS O-acetylase OafA/YrhL